MTLSEEKGSSAWLNIIPIEEHAWLYPEHG
jgi:hypothetical protein